MITYPSFVVWLPEPDGGYADAAGRRRSFETLCAAYHVPGRDFSMKAIDAETAQSRFRRDPSWSRLISERFAEIAPDIFA